MQKRDRKTKEQPRKEANVFFRLEKETKKLYDEYCLKRCFSLGKRLRSFINADMEGKIDL